MTENYPELLGEWLKRRATTRRQRYLVEFLAVRDDVKAAVEAGYPVMRIWEYMVEAGQIGCGYQTFLNYVNRHVRRDCSVQAPTTPPATMARKNVEKTPRSRETKHQEKSSQVRAPDAIPGFTFNSDPRKEDLI